MTEPSTVEPSSNTEVWELRLYVAGETAKSIAAVANLNRICNEHLPGQFQIEVVDLLKTHSLRVAIRSLQFPHWSASFRTRYARLLVTCRTPRKR